MSIVEIKNLSKSYGSIRAVRDLTLSVNEGQILALAGPDGAGKTTAFRASCGLINFDSGEISIAGFDIRHDFDNAKLHLGYMPQIFSLYPDLSVEENLNFYAGMFGIRGEILARKKKILYSFSGLEQFKKRRAGALSGGMKQKLALSCALIHDPKVLILDEPTTGVDPLSRRQFWEILKNFKMQGTAILVSTPYMDEVLQADRAIFMYNGLKLAEGTPQELTKQFKGGAYEIKIIPTSAQMEMLGKIEGLSSRRFGATLHIYTKDAGDITGYCDELARSGIVSDQIIPISPSLEDTFIQLMGK